ncbi:MAG: hypothetical protein DCC44_00695 [Acidobacteria bacterium]|nr:MAG: hypothetical protein DCC44_00695 [Acidobacteriota bacterium]
MKTLRPGTILESYSDDSRVGKPHRSKVEIRIIKGSGTSPNTAPSNIAEIKFYSLTAPDTWSLKQTLQLETHAIMDAEPHFEDFNNDGFRDITFMSGSAARGANEIRTLLIYDKRGDDLIHIKNSEDYPNLAYNRTLNCIDSWMVYGATTTVFLHLEGGMLKKFATVDTGEELIVSVIGKDGRRKIIRRQKMSLDDIYTRYTTFDPPRP